MGKILKIIKRKILFDIKKIFLYVSFKNDFLSIIALSYAKNTALIFVFLFYENTLFYKLSNIFFEII